MKKIGLLVMSLMAVSLLSSCGGSTPEPQVVEHFVTFESNGGSHIKTQRVDDGGTATDPGKSTRPGYDFKGWYTSNPNPTPIEEDKYNFSSKVTDDITLYAGWTSRNYTFTLNGTGCGIFNDPSYTQTDIKEGSNLKFSIVPDSDHTNPMTVQITKGSSCASYANGIVTITNMNSDVEVTASAEDKPTHPCLVYFNGADSTAERVIDTTKTPFTSDNIERDTEVTLELSPKVEQQFELDEDIIFLVNGVPSTNYTYTKITDTNKYSLVFIVTDKTEIYASTTEYCKLTYECSPATKTPTRIKKGQTLTGFIDPVSYNEYIFEGWYFDETYTNQCLTTHRIYNDTTIYGKLTFDEAYRPLTFTCTNSSDTGASICLALYDDFPDDEEDYIRNLFYRINGEGEWQPIADADSNGNFTIEHNATTTNEYIKILPDGITLNKGDYIQFKGNNDTFSYDYRYTEDGFYYYSLLSFNTGSDVQNQFDISGNVMSLLDADNFATLKAFNDTANGCFEYLFSTYKAPGDSDLCNIVNANKLVLPATTLSKDCYSNMFDGCKSLINAPYKLPATTLTEYCYYEMFYDCTYLKNGPVELPATTLTKKCYYNMFYDCERLVEAPYLAATTMGEESCYQMFCYCYVLSHIKVAFGADNNWISNDIDDTGDWLYDAEYWSQPVFEWKGTDDPSEIIWERDDSHVPEHWIIKTYSD